MNDPDDTTRILPAAPAPAAAEAMRAASIPSAVPLPAPVFEAGANALPAGTMLHEYRIVSTIGEGGFGIVYLADDLQLEGQVAIKEYMPSVLASRGSAGLSVSVRSARHQETFEAGRRSFVNEAKALRHFEHHPSLAKVYHFWEANGTAYMVMPFYEGVTLKELLRARGVPDEAWLRRFLRQLLEALAVVHRENWYHRDIAPDNILMLAEDRPLLLDFGAARRVIGDMTQSLTVILKPGFAPLEQYAEIPGLRQGPWTDLYALAAVVHYAIVGKAPVPSVSRLVKDSLEPLSRLAAGRYSDAFLKAIDHALAVRPEARTQSVEQFASELGPDPQESAEHQPAPRQTPAPHAGRPPPVLPIVLGSLAAIALAVGGWQLYAGRDAPVETRATAPTPPVSTQTPTPIPTPIPAPAETTDTTAAGSSAPTPDAFGPAQLLDALHTGANSEQRIEVRTPLSSVRIGKDALRFEIHSELRGYLYIFMLGTDDATVSQLFPNALDRDNRMAKGSDLVLPRPSWMMMAGGPPGVDRFVAIVSAAPRDFAAAGLRPGKPFSTFDLATARSVAASAGTAALAGRPKCGKSGATADCNVYAAVQFEITETPP